ncbi:MAG: aldehyde dehydrogenase EutE, partial [Synergistaceae bacterium]|nr:aldehyde dehydrogenase EutE [Synergistaceae bacterium]
MVDQEALVRNVAKKVMELLAASVEEAGSNGFESVDEAAETAAKAQRAWQWEYLLEDRIRIINGMRKELL